ncbi:hypothetical protein COCC4DRAFT_68595 [Bipolaris maydis ATCC 48331]|uniref:Uncharacterized protein n=1 Tax=Cochliobolus heterostrophus (strain C4 / ATCC 48331 / race T) TaxID=665024 RepID=N4XK86_COCH4|nr:uncharacterized protein COCC4DRAFT_68595 [Bipolaris maydis ATCC 48331]ENI09003.1 hypothetical protein COCC4DRAFT_68595 [Bipolaris maydis ATCC 48331]
MPCHSRPVSFTPWNPHPHAHQPACVRAAEKPNLGPTIRAWASSELMSPVADLQGPRGFVPLDKNNTSDSMTRRYRIPRIGLLPYSSGPLVGYLAISPTRLTATCSPLGQLGRAVRQR